MGMRTAAAVALLALVSAVPLAAPPQKLPAPPLREAWQFSDHGHQREAIVSGNTVFRSSDPFIGYPGTLCALNVYDGKPAWTRFLRKPLSGATLAFDGTALFASIGNGPIIACSARTGKTLWTLPHRGPCSPISVSQGTLYAEVRPGVLAAISTRSHKELWRRHIGPGSRAAPVVASPPVGTTGSVYVATTQGRVLCLSSSTGRERWRHTRSVGMSTACTLSLHGGMLLQTRGLGGIEALSTQSGRSLWRFAPFPLAIGKPLDMGGSVFVTDSRGRLYSLDRRTGRLRWRSVVGAYPGAEASPPFGVGGLVLVAVEEGVRGFDTAGKLVWTWSQLLSQDSEILKASSMGLVVKDWTEVALHAPRRKYTPPDPAAAARQIIAGFPEHGAWKQPELSDLGAYAIAELEPKVREAIRTSNANGRSLSSDHSGRALMQLARRRDTPTMVRLFRSAESDDARWPLASWLAEHADASVSSPLLLAMLKDRSLPLGPYDGAGKAARSVLLDRRDPGAIAFLTHQLNDPAADLRARAEAFAGLAGTGNRNAIEAVRKMRRQEANQAISQQLTATEAVLSAVLDARLRFAGVKLPIVVYLPRGVARLDTSGIPGPIQTTSMSVAEARSAFGAGRHMEVAFQPAYLPGVPFDHQVAGPLMYWNEDRTKAIVGINVFEPGTHDNTMYDVTVKRFGKDWLPISCEWVGACL